MISGHESYSNTSNQKLSRDDFSKVILQEVLNLALKKSHDTTLEKWEDLTSLGVVCEVWDACFGDECTEIEYNDLSKVFQSPANEKSEVEKLLDLCSEDEALRNQVKDLEESLQNNKNMLAATDILLEERDENFRIQEEELEKLKKENLLFQSQPREVEMFRTRIKNMESQYRLLKRDFDLVFATNKSTQKKMELAKQENKASRKTILALANRLSKLEMEYKEGLNLRTNAFGNLEEIVNTAANMENHNDTTDWNAQQMNQQPQPHMVWDPAVRALVPVVYIDQRNGKKDYKNQRKHYHNNNNNNYHNNYYNNKNYHKKNNHKHNHHHKSNNRLVSPFPRRYTSSHIPRYRRKFEMTELNRIKQNKV